MKRLTIVLAIVFLIPVTIFSQSRSPTPFLNFDSRTIDWRAVSVVKPLVFDADILMLITALLPLGAVLQIFWSAGSKWIAVIIILLALVVVVRAAQLILTTKLKK
jgi:hypothetical protein